MACHIRVFESFANSERYKTGDSEKDKTIAFESFANSERYKTSIISLFNMPSFESFANSERYKTVHALCQHHKSLRALLIQKDTKR